MSLSFPRVWQVSRIKGSQVDSPGCCISFWAASKHTEQWRSCAEHRRGKAADTKFFAPLSSVPHRVSTAGHTEAEPSQGKQGGHTHTNLGASINTFLLALRIPEYSVLTKKPLRAVEPKTNLRTGHRRVGFRELLYQSSPHSATLHVYIRLYPFLLSTFTIPGYVVIKTQLLRSTVLIERFPLKCWQWWKILPANFAQLNIPSHIYTCSSYQNITTRLIHL